MMALQRITWIALPDGFAAPDGAGRARLSVFVSPQLQPDEAATLAPFDFVDWPARLDSGTIGFQVGFGNARVRAEIVSRTEPRLWRALFDGQTFVRPHAPDVTSPVFGSYPAARMHELLKSGYQELGTGSPLEGTAQDVIPAAFAEVHELFGPAPEGVDVEDPALSERERRVRLARELFRPDAADQIARRLGRLVDLARSESAHTLGAAPEFVPVVPDTGAAASTLAQFMVYHRQPGGAAGAQEDRADARLDFHQRLTALTEYPKLLRLLGLVIDLELAPGEIPEATPGAPGLIRLIPSFTAPAGVGTAFLTPETAYVFQRGRVFAAAATRPGDRTDETVSGFLNLRPPISPGSSEDQFRIVQVDADGGGLKLLDLLARALSAGPPSDGADDGQRRFTLPPLRSGGVSITRHGLAPFLHEVLTTGRQNMAALAAGEPVTLFGEDLLRGFRVDVGDPASGEWHSLHERDGTYRFLELQEEREISDEGCVQGTLVQPDARREGPGPSTPDPSMPNYLSEYLFLWQGWSLAASRPGQSLPQPQMPTPVPPDATPGQGLGLEVSFRPRRGSLPRLRFGQSYRLRARVVDLAGNALDREEADRLIASLGADAPVLPPPAGTVDGSAGPGSRSDFRFLRFEVVPSPLVVARAGGRQGESVERIVIRSNQDLTPDAYATLHAASHPEYALAGERHLAPPKTWQLLAEMSGCFDAAIGTGTDHDRMRDLALREQGSLRRGGVHPEPAIDVDWLPDPLAAGACFRGVPGAPAGTVGRVTGERLEFTALPLSPARSGEAGPVVTIDFGPASAWPDLSSFRLRLAEGAGPPSWNAAERVLTVSLPKGESRTMRVSCHLQDEAALELLGIWRWIVERLHDQVQGGQLSAPEMSVLLAELKQLSLLGLSRMLTPYRELTLVHAVQQPLEPPVILSFTPVRLLNSTFVYTRGRVRVHVASTGSVELTARWTEKLDDLQELEPGDVHFEAQVFATPFPLPGPGEPAVPAPAAEGSVPVAIFDTAASVVEFPGPAMEAVAQTVAAAASRLGAARGRLSQAALQAGVPDAFSEFGSMAASIIALAAGPAAEKSWGEVASQARVLEAEVDTVLADFNPPDLPEPEPEALRRPLGDIARAAGEMAAKAEAALAVPGRFRGRHEFGDTKHRRVCYQVVATTRFGECFDREDDEVVLTRTSECATVDVLSSSPPAPPRVRYILPAFSWHRAGTEPDSSDVTSERRGGALRVYLDRPWYSSGDGELLGVVVATSREVEETLRRTRTLVTQLGRDPLWISPRTGSLPTPADFRNAATDQPLEPPFTSVLGFDVEFDHRGRCFCDIELAPGGAYYPFVRLALLRFQPRSIPGVATSSTVLADFAQLVPDRAVTVVGRADDHFAVAVTGQTHESPTNPLDPAGRGTRIRVSAQKRIPGTTDDAGWIPAGANAVITPETTVPTRPLLWSGTVTLPSARVRGQFRVLIEELETYRGLDPLSPGPGAVLVDRVVFAETVEI